MKEVTRRQVPAALSMIIITFVVVTGIFIGLYFFYISGRTANKAESIQTDAVVNEPLAPEAQVVIVHTGNMAQVKAFDIAIHLQNQQMAEDGTFSNTILVTRLSDQSAIGELTFSELGRPNTLDEFTIRTLHTTESSAQFAVQLTEATQLFNE